MTDHTPALDDRIESLMAAVATAEADRDRAIRMAAGVAQRLTRAEAKLKDVRAALEDSATESDRERWEREKQRVKATYKDSHGELEQQTRALEAAKALLAAVDAGLIAGAHVDEIRNCATELRVALEDSATEEPGPRGYEKVTPLEDSATEEK